MSKEKISDKEFAVFANAGKKGQKAWRERIGEDAYREAKRGAQKKMMEQRRKREEVKLSTTTPSGLHKKIV